MAGAGNSSDRRIAVGRSQLVWRDAPVLAVGLPGWGPPILARDRPICSMARGTAAFRREETCAFGCTDWGWMPGGEPAAPGCRQVQRRCPGPRRGQQPAVPGMDHGVPLPRPPQGRRALQLAGAWRLAGTCGQRLHRGVAAGEAPAAESPNPGWPLPGHVMTHPGTGPGTGVWEKFKLDGREW